MSGLNKGGLLSPVNEGDNIDNLNKGNFSKKGRLEGNYNIQGFNGSNKGNYEFNNNYNQFIAKLKEEKKKFKDFTNNK